MGKYSCWIRVIKVSAPIDSVQLYVERQHLQRSDAESTHHSPSEKATNQDEEEDVQQVIVRFLSKRNSEELPPLGDIGEFVVKSIKPKEAIAHHPDFSEAKKGRF